MIPDPDADLMWAQAASHTVLKKCFNWHNAQVWVKNLTTYFVTGMGFFQRLSSYTKGGVRAVRSIKK